MQKTFLKIDGLLTIQEFRFLQTHIPNLADDTIFAGAMEVNADSSLVTTLSSNGFRIAMNSSDEHLNIHILDRLDKDDREHLSDTEKFDINLKDFFDDYKFIYDEKEIEKHMNVIFATNTRFGIDQYKYLLQTINLLDTPTILFDYLVSYTVKLNKQIDFIKDSDVDLMNRLNAEYNYRHHLGTWTEDLKKYSGKTEDEILEGERKRKDYEKFVHRLSSADFKDRGISKEEYLELCINDELARQKENDELVNILNKEDKKEFISKKHVLPSYQDKYIDIESVVSDIENNDSKEVSFFVVKDARVVCNMEDNYFYMFDFLKNSNVDKYVHFENCEFFFVGPTKIETFLLQFNQYFFTKNTIINLIQAQNYHTIEDIDVSSCYAPKEINISLKDVLFNSTDDICQSKVIINSKDNESDCFICETPDTQTISTLEKFIAKFDYMEEIDHIFDELIEVKVKSAY